MKKFFNIFLALLLVLAGFTGCSKKTNVTFYVPDGAPLLSVAGLLSEKPEFPGVSINYGEAMVTGEVIRQKVTGGTADIAIAPVNVCAAGYNKFGYVLLGINVWGLLHLVSADENVRDFSDLIGETVYAFQKDGTPGLTLRALINMQLKKSDSDDAVYYKELTAEEPGAAGDKVNILFLNDVGLVKAAVTAGKLEGKDTPVKHAVLAEPAVAELIKSGKAKRAIDMQEAWKDITGSSFPQAGLIIKKELIETNKNFVDEFLAKVSENSDFVRLNADEAANISKDILSSSDLPGDKSVISSFIKKEGQEALRFTSAADSKDSVLSYFTALGAVSGNLQFAGGKMPGGDFFYNFL